MLLKVIVHMSYLHFQLMGTIWPTYVNPPGIKIDDMQKEIEIPQIYMLGISKGTTKSERSFDDIIIIIIIIKFKHQATKHII